MKIKPSHYVVNEITGLCEMHVVGSLYQGRLDKKVKAILAGLPEGSFVMPPKATWKLYVECSTACRDAYEIRFMVKDARAVSDALFRMSMV